jgi:hypothetical protein
LSDDIDADHLIADKGYDTDAILEQATGQGMNAVSSRPRKTEPFKVPTTRTSTSCAISSKTHFFI